MQFTQAPIEDGHRDRDYSHDQAAKGERSLCAKVVRGSPGSNVSYGHRAHERKDEHAHHATSHLISYKMLKQGIGSRDRNNKGKAQTKEEG